MLAALAAIGTIGCGAQQSTAPSLANAEAAVRAAREVGATQLPRAALHVRYAEEQIHEAERLIDEGELDRATTILDRATADAELAITLAKSSAARREAESARARVEELREGIGG
jgi:hypothetical protein